jgi:hypothetical protein
MAGQCFKEVVCEDVHCINLAQDRDRWQVRVEISSSIRDVDIFN